MVVDGIAVSSNEIVSSVSALAAVALIYNIGQQVFIYVTQLQTKSAETFGQCYFLHFIGFHLVFSLYIVAPFAIVRPFAEALKQTALM